MFRVLTITFYYWIIILQLLYDRFGKAPSLHLLVPISNFNWLVSVIIGILLWVVNTSTTHLMACPLVSMAPLHNPAWEAPQGLLHSQSQAHFHCTTHCLPSMANTVGTQNIETTVRLITVKASGYNLASGGKMLTWWLLPPSMLCRCTINIKIKGTPNGVYMPISKLHSILALANLLAHNNLWLCYYGQVNYARLK